MQETICAASLDSCVLRERSVWMWQVLSTRARKDVKVADIKVQVCLYAFDCLYLNGQVLVDRPLTERREALYSAIQEKPGELFYATAKVHCCPWVPSPPLASRCCSCWTLPLSVAIA